MFSCAIETSKPLVLQKFEHFFVFFKDSYILFFVNTAKDYAIKMEDIKLMSTGSNLYQAFFIDGKVNFCGDLEFFRFVDKYNIDLGFMISKTFLYLLENFAKKDDVSKNDLDMFCLHVKNVMQSIEDISAKKKDAPNHISFDKSGIFGVGRPVLEELLYLRDHYAKVTFVNIYKEVIVKDECEIIDVEGDSAIFRTPLLIQTAMQLEGKTFIHIHSSTDRYFKADIVYCNFYNQKTYLSNFVPLLNLPALDRKNVRVHPEIQANVVVGGVEQETIGKLYDISKNGIGVISEYNNGVVRGSRVSSFFTLTDSKGNVSNINVDGVVMEIIQYVGASRFCIKTEPDQLNADLIAKYVDDRELEIIDELRVIANGYGAI